MTEEKKRRRELTPEEKAEALRLSAAWEAYKRDNKGASQGWLGRVSGIGSQSAVGQYLRGILPLNLKVLFAICKHINASPQKISPRLATSITEPASNSAIKDDSVNEAALARFQRLVYIYWRSSEIGQQQILRIAENVETAATDEHPEERDKLV